MSSPEPSVAASAELIAAVTDAALAMVLCHAVSASPRSALGEHDAN